MKKAAALCIAMLIVIVSLTGCDDESNYRLPFVAADVEQLEVFTGSVPAQAVKKIITLEDDVQNIINALNALIIERGATNDDFLAGGIGIQFYFHLANGDTYFVSNNGNLLHKTDGTFVVGGTSLSTDEFWKSLIYDEQHVGQWGLPNADLSVSHFSFFGWEEMAVNVSHSVALTTTEWVIDDKQEIDKLGDWFRGLSVQLRRFADGESPGDSDGGASYAFTLVNSNISFSYIIGGTDSYILYDSEWFHVKNPSDPF